MTVNHQSFLKFRFVVLLGSHSMIFVGSGSLFLIAITLKDLASEFGWPREVPSLAFSLQFIGGGLGGIFMGYLLDRVGAVVLPVVATFAVVSGSILTTLVHAEWQLFAVYLFLFGFLGQGSLYAPLMANISRWYDRRRGMAVGIVSSGQSLSGIIWPPIFTLIVTEVGWRTGFIGFGIVAGAIMLPMCLIFVRKPPSAEQLKLAEEAEGPDKKGRARRPARNSTTNLSYRQLQVVLCVAIVGCCISMALPLAHLVSFGTDFGLSLNEAGWIFSAMLTAAFISRLIFVGLLSDRFGSLWALFCFSVLQAAMVIMLANADSVFFLLILGIGFGLGYGGIFPVYAVIIREYMPPKEAGRRTGIVFLFGAIAMGIGSWMGGAIFDLNKNYDLAFLIGFAANCVNLLIIGALLTKARPAEPTEVVA